MQKFIKYFYFSCNSFFGIFILEVVECAKALCILCHRVVQLILAYSWARPGILVADKDSVGMFLFLLFLHFHSCSSFFPVSLIYSSLLLSLLSLFSLSLGDDPKRSTRVDVSLNPDTIIIIIIITIIIIIIIIIYFDISFPW